MSRDAARQVHAVRLMKIKNEKSDIAGFNYSGQIFIFSFLNHTNGFMYLPINYFYFYIAAVTWFKLLSGSK